MSNKELKNLPTTKEMTIQFFIEPKRDQPPYLIN